MRQPFIEALESRHFLSATLIGNQFCTCDPPPDVPTLSAAVVTSDFQLSDIVGKWKGTIATNLRPRPFKATINITSVSPAGKISGTVSVPFLLSNYKFAINTRKSKVNSDGTFTAKFSKFGVSGQLSGHYDDGTKHVVGNFTAAAPGKNVSGTFDFQRIH